MEKISRRSKIIFAVLLVAVVVSVVAFSYAVQKDDVILSGELLENYNFGEFTFQEEMTLSDGRTARYYKSGDEYFSYAHDNEGYVLVEDKEKGTLEYAISKNGVPVASGVAYGAEEGKISSIKRMRLGDIDTTAEEVISNAKGLDGMSVIESAPILAPAQGETQNMVNLVVFIAFADDNFLPDSQLLNMFNGTSTSLKSYYQVMSNGAVNINSLMPYRNSQLFVYKDSNSRYYYDTNGRDRWNKESTLISNAIKAATGVTQGSEHDSYYSIPQGTDLDVNDDNYIDSLSVIVYGSSSSTWGSLLWPHSVNLDAIDGDYYTAVNGVKVGKYSFNFSNSITLGVLCHETAHVLGAPDLYHYGTDGTQNQDIVTVGKWDLMENDLDTPQYLLTYMRKNYIGGIGDNQIGEITENGVYSLEPVSISNENRTSNLLAYKIPTSKEGEYFMVEYRRQTNSGYDSMLPGSGLIIYRVKEPEDFTTSEGNINAYYHGTGENADEVFVMRPSIKMTGEEGAAARYYNSLYDIDRAYLSPTNTHYSVIGKETSDKRYDLGTLYYTDGSNSGIIIEALSISANSIQFSVRLGSNIVDDDYFDDKIKIKEANYVDATYAGVTASVEFMEIEPKYLSALTLELQDANGDRIVTNELNLGRFLSDYNASSRLFLSDFIYADKGNTIDSTAFNRGLFVSDNAPVKAVLTVVDADGDTKIIDEVNVQNPSGISWETIVSSKTELSAAIFASSKMTLGVRRDGTLDASGSNKLGEQWNVDGYSGIVDVALGYTHTLLLTSNLSVLALGTDNYSETDVNSWYDVKAVAAGTYSSYGLKTNGTVVATGLNDKGQLNVSSWTGIMQISAISKRIAAVNMAGSVVVAGNFSESEKESIQALRNVSAVSVGINFLAVLKTDGTVEIVGNLPQGDVSGFTNVTKIVAGTHHLLALTADGKVLACGDNSYGQSMVYGLYDIIDIAAGEYHSAFLREDGVVEFRGSGNDKYSTNTGIGNLLYDNYVNVTAITVTGVVNNTVSVAKGARSEIIVIKEPLTATYARMIFESKDVSVASVKANGYNTATVYGIGVGSTEITIRVNGTNIVKTVTVEVYEHKELTGIEFRETERSIVSGQSSYLSLFTVPEDASFIGNVTFTSSNSDVVSVTSAGLITALGVAGDSAVITAKLQNFEVSITVNIVGQVDGIAVEVLDSSAYRYLEDLDFSRYVLKVTVGSTVEEVTMTEDMISNYNKEDVTTVNQILTVRYMGCSTTFTVSVKDYVVKIVQTEAPILSYLYGEDLKTSGAYDVYYAKREASKGNSFAVENYLGYDKTRIGRQEITYVHTDTNWQEKFTIVHEVSVVDFVESISFKPYKTSYLYGEELDLDEFVDLNMASGNVRQIELRGCSVKDLHTACQNENIVVEGVTTKNPLYSLYSTRIGDHLLEISYTDLNTAETLKTTTIVNVDIVGMYKLTGAVVLENLGDTSYFCYEVGEDLYLNLILVQEGTADVIISNDETQNIWYKAFTLKDEEEPFDNSIIGEKEGKIRVSVVKQTLNGTDAVLGNVEVGVLSMITYGLAKTTNVKIQDGAKTTYIYGEKINEDPTNRDISIELTLEDGSKNVVAPMEISYNSERIGVQTLQVRYLDTWLPLDITINDYVVELQKIEDIEVLYGEAITFEVYAIYARSGRLLLEEGYTVSHYANTVVGEQDVVVTLSADNKIATAFKITVLDVFDGIKVKEAPKTKYAKGETFDPTSTYIVTMISGATQEIAYNDRDFYCYPSTIVFEDVDVSKTISIYYKGYGIATPIRVWYDSCKVPNYVTKLEVVENSVNNKKEYKYNEELKLVVRATYADNSQTTLKSSSYSTNYDATLVGTQKLTINYVYSGITYSINYEITVVDTPSTIKIKTAPTKTQYGYGDVINWSGAEVEVTFEAAGKVTYLGDKVKSLNVTYTTLVAGAQRVTVGIETVSTFFNITVGKDTSAAVPKNTDNITADIVKRTISLLDTAFVSDVLGSLEVSSYLEAEYVSVQKVGKIDLQLDINSLKAGSGDKLIFKNADGKTVFEFSVYLKGDANGDGKVTGEDLEGLAEMLASGKLEAAIIDYNGDGKLNLTDLVNYARKTGGAPESVPVSDVAKEFVAPIKFKGKEEEVNA